MCPSSSCVAVFVTWGKSLIPFFLRRTATHGAPPPPPPLLSLVVRRQARATDSASTAHARLRLSFFVQSRVSNPDCLSQCGGAEQVATEVFYTVQHPPHTTRRRSRRGCACAYRHERAARIKGSKEVHDARDQAVGVLHAAGECPCAQRVGERLGSGRGRVVALGLKIEVSSSLNNQMQTVTFASGAVKIGGGVRAGAAAI